MRAPPRVSVRGFEPRRGRHASRVRVRGRARVRALPRRRLSRASASRRGRRRETTEKRPEKRRDGKTLPSFFRGHSKPVAWLAASSERVYAAGLGALGDGAGQTPSLVRLRRGDPRRDETGTRTEEEIPGDNRRDRARWFSPRGGTRRRPPRRVDERGRRRGRRRRRRRVRRRRDRSPRATARRGRARGGRRRRDASPPAEARRSCREEGSANAVVGNVAPEGGARASAAGVASDGNVVAIGCENGEVPLRESRDLIGDARRSRGGGVAETPGEVTAARFHPSDPSTLATCDANREVLVWNSQTPGRW